MEGLNYIPEDMVFSFTDVTKAVFNTVVDAVQEAQTEEDEAEGRFIIPFFTSGGCNDAFSGFGFLAFLLALLDLILELSMDDDDDARRRYGREASDYAKSAPEELFLMNRFKSNPEIEEASSACFCMYRGFLNALATPNGECAKRFLCEGAQEAASQGRLGKMIALVASENAATWLAHENSTRYQNANEGGIVGTGGGSCGMTFSQCFSLPSVYRYPRILIEDEDTDYIPP